jgi:hypothetical protein
MLAQKVDGLYRLKDELIDQCPQHVINYNAESIKRAHDIMGHRAFNVIRQMLNLPLNRKIVPTQFVAHATMQRRKITRTHRRKLQHELTVLV